ncbi:MAG TPA: hypothetical protein VFH38_01960 [Jatrophihabitans sp.]|nr:hypothetical protein [Jatrophihabitans sp.]
MPKTTARRWATQDPVKDEELERCPVCQDGDALDRAPASYCYLLGQYLGDGHLVTRARVPVLRVYACTDYPEVTREIGSAVRSVRGREPGLVTGPARSERVVTVQSYWMHWPCLFPQHGPGRKHERRIVLAPWQQELVETHPWPLIRGLIHSDGCRATNRVRAHGTTYAYPRYFFSNKSADILAIFTDALDRVGVQWRLNRYDSVSVARRTSVARLDEHVGAKR